MTYEYAGKEFNTRFLVVGKEQGCKYCNNLKSFLEFGLEGKFDSQITIVNLETNPEDYELVIGETGAMSLPVVLDISENKYITGFNPPELTDLLRA